MDVISQYQQIIIHGAENKGECIILAVRNIKLVIKKLRKTNMQIVAIHRTVIAP